MTSVHPLNATHELVLSRGTMQRLLDMPDGMLLHSIVYQPEHDSFIVRAIVADDVVNAAWVRAVREKDGEMVGNGEGEG